jgi:hypothetical protein
MWINAVSCCEFHFYGFVIMNFSACFLEKVKIDMLYSFLYFHYVKHFFYRARSFFVESCGPSTEILEPTLAFVHDQRSAPSLSSRRKLIQLLLHRFVHKKLVLLHCRVETLQCSLPCRCYTPAVTHHGRDYAQVPDNLLIFVDYLF